MSKYMVKAEYTKEARKKLGIPIYANSPVIVHFDPSEGSQMTQLFSTWTADTERFDLVSFYVKAADDTYVLILDSAPLREQQARAAIDAKFNPNAGVPQPFGKKPPFVK